MPTLVEINMINKHMGLLKLKRSMPTEYYPKRLTNLPRKKRKDQHTHINHGLMIKLFTPYELFVGSVNLIENIPDSILETCLEIILQLTYVSYPIKL